jgi:hypothetical protein
MAASPYQAYAIQQIFGPGSSETVGRISVYAPSGKNPRFRSQCTRRPDKRSRAIRQTHDSAANTSVKNKTR